MQEFTYYIKFVIDTIFAKSVDNEYIVSEEERQEISLAQKKYGKVSLKLKNTLVSYYEQFVKAFVYAKNLFRKEYSLTGFNTKCKVRLRFSIGLVSSWL